jgi:aryl-alcohol dehydrogenase-like predicted oxidoreductase
MIYRTLGTSGLEASVVGLGAWAIGGWMWGGADETDAIRAIHTALDQGINLIDTAPEELVGKAICDRREDVVLATKCGLIWHAEKGSHYFNSDEQHPDKDAEKWRVYKYLGPESIRYEVEQSLKRLKTDWIDLYQTHWQDPTTPIGETMAELEKLKQEGKIRAIGVSNATPEQMDEYLAVGRIESDQELYSMLDRDKEADNLPHCLENRLAFLAYSPLAQGLLTGKVGPDRTFSEGDQRSRKARFSRKNRERVQAMLAEFSPIASDLGLSLAQLTIAWTFVQPGCSHVLVGARNPTQAEENARAGTELLTEDVVTRMTEILESHSEGIV